MNKQIKHYACISGAALLIVGIVFMSVKGDVIVSTSKTNIAVSNNNLEYISVSEQEDDYSISDNSVSFSTVPEEVVDNASDDFKEFKNEFNTWVESKGQYTISIKHAMKSDSMEMDIAESTTQVDLNTGEVHQVVLKPNYNFDSWYTLDNSEYITTLDCDGGHCSWVDISDETGDIRDFFTAQRSAKSTLSIFETMLNLCNNSEVSRYDYQDSWRVSYRGTNPINDGFTPGFLKVGNFVDYSICLSRIDDTVYGKIEYTYDESSIVKTETYTYTITITDTLNLEVPSCTETNVSTMEDMTAVYEAIKEN